MRVYVCVFVLCFLPVVLYELSFFTLSFGYKRAPMGPGMLVGWSRIFSQICLLRSNRFFLHIFVSHPNPSISHCAFRFRLSSGCFAASHFAFLLCLFTLPLFLFSCWVFSFPFVNYLMTALLFARSVCVYVIFLPINHSLCEPSCQALLLDGCAFLSVYVIIFFIPRFCPRHTEYAHNVQSSMAGVVFFPSFFINSLLSPYFPDPLFIRPLNGFTVFFGAHSLSLFSLSSRMPSITLVVMFCRHRSFPFALDLPETIWLLF
uniref:Uncharacterized protein n=1 Tax=Anopheles aquasalis TaxID=42839 RepID=T1DP72_ANOAQ